MLPAINTAARKLLPRNPFARGVSILVGGTAGAQVLLVISAPLLTRLYSPEDFGLVALFTAMLSLFSVVACLRYELAIPLPDDDEDAANLVGLALVSVAIFTACAALLVFFFGDDIARMLDSPQLARYLWLLPLGVLLAGTYQTFSKWAIRSKSFKNVAKTRFSQSLTTIGIQLLSFKTGALGLILGYTAGQAAGCGGLGASALKHPAFRRLSFAKMLAVGRRYREFPIYSTWNGLANTASLQLAPMAFATLFGASVAGFYALTLRILTMPSSLVGNAVASVFLAHAPQAHREGRLKQLVEPLHEKLTMAGVPALFVLLATGPDLFALVFGEHWRKAGQYAQWMAPWIYLQFQWSPLSMLASVLNLQREALIMQLLTLFIRFMTLLGCVWLGTSSDTAVLAFAVASACVYFIRMLWFMWRAGISPLFIAWTEAKHLLVFGLLTSPAMVLWLLGSGWTQGAGAALFVGCALAWYWRLARHSGGDLAG